MPIEVIDKVKPANGSTEFKVADPIDISPTLQNSASLEDDINALNELIKKAASNGSFYIGAEPPKDVNKVWFDTDDTAPDHALTSVYPDESLIVGNYYDAIQEIKSKVDKVSYALNKELEPGGFKIRTESGSYVSSIDGSANNPAEDSDFYPENPTPDDDVFIPSNGNPDGQVQYEIDKFIGKSNVSTIRVKRGTKYNMPTLKDGEMAFCKDTGELYIGNVTNKGYTITKIGSSGSSGGNGGGGNLSGEYLDIQSPNGTSYRVKITDSGIMTVLPKTTYDLTPVTPESSEINTDYKGLIINQMYGGGTVMGDIEYDNSGMIVKTKSKGYVSHSFVELYNNSSTRKDLLLDGLSLQYKGPTGGWQSLPLKGVIPWRHSFLVRGLQHFPMGPDEITRLEIDRYDMQWNIAFSDKGFSMYLGAGTTPMQITNPADLDGDGKRKQEGFIDLVGAGGKKTTETVSAYMKRFWHILDNKTAALRVDNNDPYNGNLDENSNRDSVEAIDYSTCDVDIYRPRCIADGEWDSYVTKQQLNPNAPSMINISFGYDGDTSRSFNWHTYQSSEGVIRYRKMGEYKWKEKESDKKNIKHHDCDSTIHSVTLYNLEPGATYEYKCGYDGHFSDIYTFVMDKFAKSANPAEGEKEHMRILWTSDQQSWTPYEYQAWKVASEYIREHEDYDWLLNTGDISQNGMRGFEWRYYYKYATDTRTMCHEISVGNNDLGGGADKNDSTPITYYLTHDNKHPEVNGCYSYNVGCCHFFCLNSNQKDVTAFSSYKQLFKSQIDWLREDLKKNASMRWCIGFMHLSPVTCVRGKHQQMFLDVFQEFRVHLVLCGHNHTYSRSIPLANLPVDTTITIKAATETTKFQDSSLPEELKSITNQADFVKACKDRYMSVEDGTVYCMCQATGYKLAGKEGQMNGAWWYGWKGPHPSAPSYNMLDITWDRIDLEAYRIDGIVPTKNDDAEFYITPPIPVGPERYEGNPIYGGTAQKASPVEAVCIDYMSDTRHADSKYNSLFDYGTGSLKWRPWGPKNKGNKDNQDNQ